MIRVLKNRLMLASRSIRRALSALPLALVATALTGTAHAAVSVDDTPTESWQVNGPVYASTVIGDTVYVGGRFTKIVSSTGETKDRAHLAAFSISTGKPLPWSPQADGVVWALETNGSTTVWAGGEFTKVDGREHERLVRVNAKTGEVDRRFDVGVNGTVRAVELSRGMLFVGGGFTKVGKDCQKYLTKVNATSGAVPHGFSPKVEDMVRAIVAPESASGFDVYIAGNFFSYNGVAQRKVALINGANGKLAPLTFEKPATTRGLDISPDGSVLYGAIGGDVNSAVAWSTTTGARVWRYKVVGDVHTVAYHDGTVWAGFAEGTTLDPKARLQALDAATGVVDPTFAPTFNSLWGVRTIAATDRGVVAAGNFWKIDGKSQQYLAFFR